MMVLVSLQNKVAIMPLVEFGSNIFGNGRHRVNVVMDAFAFADQIQERCFPIGHLDTDFLENARWNCSDDYRIHLGDLSAFHRAVGQDRFRGG